MVINIQAKSVYGQIKFYPAGPAAQALADIAGTKTLEPRILKTAVVGLNAKVMIVDGSSAEALKVLYAAGVLVD